MNDTPTQDVAKKELTQSERFMAMVMKEFRSGVGELALAESQKRLAQNYFIDLDRTLRTAEEKRLKKSDKYRDNLPITWSNVNMEKLAQDVVSLARIGLDPLQKNHVSMVPFKNNALNNYSITFIEGYRGLEIKADKYGLDVPDHVVVELVYTNDRFKSIKKDRNNKYETYEFEIVDDFDRGEIKGGFYFHVFSENPEKNKLVVMPLKEILKRKPEHASVEFWGGEKDVWEKNQATGKNEKTGTVKVEGWFEKMCYKTVYRAAYSDITIDSTKIDEDYLRLKAMEAEADRVEVEQHMSENANKTVIDATYTEVPDDPQPDGQPPAEPTQPETAAAGAGTSGTKKAPF